MATLNGFYSKTYGNSLLSCDLCRDVIQGFVFHRSKQAFESIVSLSLLLDL